MFHNLHKRPQSVDWEPAADRDSRLADLSRVRQDERDSARRRRRNSSAADPAAPATPPAAEARFPRLRKLLGRIKQAGQAAGQVVMDWLSIPRQLRYLAWVLIALAVVYLLLKALRRT
jgi:hypothetical protein